MIRISFTVFPLLLIGFILTGCAGKNEHEDKNPITDKWFSETKVLILKQAALKPDSTSSTYNENRTFRTDHFFSQGHEFISKGYNDGVLRVERHFSKDEEFELIREICDNGNYGFEGIMHLGNFVGLSTWRHCTGKLSEQGNRYNDKKIGIWRRYDRDGELVEETDYANLDKLDSLPKIGGL